MIGPSIITVLVLFSQSVSAVSVGPLYPSFVSLSIELASFPSFAGKLMSSFAAQYLNVANSQAGTREAPNIFSRNLLDNLAEFQGQPAVIRVGGNSG